MSLHLPIAYCTNVHAGPDWDTVIVNLATYTLGVRDLLRASGAWQPKEPLGVGLWLAESAVKDALAEKGPTKSTAWLRNWLSENEIVPFTMNGFPQGNFHQPVVKHGVYLPTWWEKDRYHYTQMLISFLDQVLPQGVAGSISTLPIAWGDPAPRPDQLQQAANNFCDIAHQLHDLYERTGRTIVLAIEPEPGCYLSNNACLRKFFQDYLFRDDTTNEKIRKYITVCYDICHAAVMFEDQAAELKAHQNHGLRIGKVQVSSAIEIDWSKLDPLAKEIAFQQLANFAEDRYLHQTMIRSQSSRILIEDLPELLAKTKAPNELKGKWRVHFHVPIFYDGFDDSTSIKNRLGTTQAEILKCITLLAGANGSSIHESTLQKQFLANDFLDDFFTGHYEVETYAWSVLPEALRQSSLVQDISREMTYLKNLLHKNLLKPEASH